MQQPSPVRDTGLDALEVLDLIRRLPEAYREPMILRLVEGMTGPEIAQQTGLTADSVRVNLCRGMKMLRGLLGGMGEK
jgi:RNA polymerase sigma-70 factor (ECF subfamily)